MDNIKEKLGGLLGNEEVSKKVNEVVGKLNKDENLLAKFKADPEKTIESMTGIDIPDGIADKVINGVKAALSGDKAGSLLEKAKDLLTGGDK